MLIMPLLACGGSQKPKPVTFAPARPADFSGHWEVDYSRSENVQTKLNAVIREVQREQARRARAIEQGRSPGPAQSGRNSWRSIIGLAEMADLITAIELVEIVQSDREVRIKRDNSFALICDIRKPPPVVQMTAFGSERCGWDGHQLYFQIALPDGLTIEHRITMAQTRDLLGISTTVSSGQVSESFLVNKVYARYDPESAGYRCRQTLSKGRVCSTEGL
ncbi:hypothetical protein NOR51B_1415 [Luminiphilus syltensis NOR5-1B]|uniref:Uncharacterized protein n=1 Tax=Luminiphilus syltensis NOR5-1B TaxID=565045 RepID=B8KYC6_9GAMM|nr:hypothetical protein NOR51B_1415 [Luminiphilus syltensis NOR5-1B]